MKLIYKISLGVFFLTFILGGCQKDNAPTPLINYVTALTDTLNQLSARSDNAFFKLHCESVIRVIEAYEDADPINTDWIEDAYISFSTETILSSPRDLSSYINRNRPFIISWESPTDGAVSFAKLYPPDNWDPSAEYPLYVSLHGAGDLTDNPIKYLIYPFITFANESSVFNDGYLLLPWGRGNIWYRDIAETDIWECIDVLENLVNINQNRKYMLGHSMGGYGAWHFGIISPDTWAAIGLSIAIIWHDESEITQESVNILKDVPVYFLCGSTDVGTPDNQEVYEKLVAAGNENTSFVTFEGGHTVTHAGLEGMYLWLKQFSKDQ